MMSDKKNKMASIIVSGMGKSDEMAPEKDGAQQDDSVASESAAEELISAIHSKSAKGVVEAMKNCLAVMDKDEDESEESGGQEIGPDEKDYSSQDNV